MTALKWVINWTIRLCHSSTDGTGRNWDKNIHSFNHSFIHIQSLSWELLLVDMMILGTLEKPWMRFLQGSRELILKIYKMKWMVWDSTRISSLKLEVLCLKLDNNKKKQKSLNILLYFFSQFLNRPVEIRVHNEARRGMCLMVAMDTAQ